MANATRITALAAIAVVLTTGDAAVLPAQVTTLSEQQTRLRDAKAEAAQAETRAAALERAADAARDEALQARAREAALSARIRGAQADIAAAEARIAIIDRLLGQARKTLAERQQPILHLVAAIQSLARRPAALSIVQPGSTRDIVHIRAVLGSVVPVVEARSADVRTDIDRIADLRDQATRAVAGLSDSRERLEANRTALVRLEAEHRLRAVDYRRTALVESDRALSLGEQARDIVDLMGSLGEAATTRTTLERLPGPLPRPPQPGATATPVVASERRLPPYRLPVAGQIVAGLGEISAGGVRSRGLTLATAPGARAVAPAAGRVLFARGFRDYGTVVIIDHGGGWTSLIAGLASASVKTGDTIAAGDTIGATPDGDAPTVTIELRRRGRPVDMTPLLD